MTTTDAMVTPEAGPRGRPSLSVVIPVHNSEVILPKLVARLGAVLPSLADRFEVILVNDGSRDRSWAAVQALASTRPWITGVDLVRNFGQHNATLAGIRLARHEVILTIDDDLQHPPEEFPLLLRKLEEGFDVVYGAPNQTVHSYPRVVASKLTRIPLQAAMGDDIARSVSSFRAFRTRLRETFRDYSGTFISIEVLLTWATQRFAVVNVDYAPREAGTSNYDFRRLLTHAFNMLTGFSTAPLQLASWVGFVFTLLGGAVLFYVVGRYLIEGGSVPGFPFLASIIALFSGAQLFALGIIGEYLARMHVRLLGRPSYVIRTTTSDPTDAPPPPPKPLSGAPLRGPPSP